MKETRIYLTETEQNELEKITRAHNSGQALVFRSRIILLVAYGYFVKEVAAQLDTSTKTVLKWVKCWRTRGGTIEERLSDAPRAGRPVHYSPEEFVEVIEMACQRPSKYGLPISQWTAKELWEQLKKEKTAKAEENEEIEVMSVRHIQRTLEDAKIKPHKSRYWLFPKDDPEAEKKTKEICAAYLEAPVVYDEERIVTISVDEKTGIQALEREIRDVEQPGQTKQIEFEYTRHGTLCLFASFDVVTGEVIGTCNPTRDSNDFSSFMKSISVHYSEATQVRVVLDNLNTHMSEDLVRLVARLNGEVDIDLGKVGKSGILKSMKTRAAYLSRKNNWLRFIYTPKHRSWLNQVEIWFSILVRKLLKRSSFKTLDELESDIESFISYFNEKLAKPFKWTYTGKALQA